MKKSIGLIMTVCIISLASCSKEVEVSWNASHEFRIENIMGEEVKAILDMDSRAVNSNGFIKSEYSNALSGTYVAGSASSYLDKTIVGFSFHIKYNFLKEEQSHDFTDAMFQSLWYEGAVHKLGMEGEDLFDNSFIYIGMINAEGVLQKYVTEVNASDDNSQLEIISKEFAGKSNKGRDVYEVKVNFQSRLVNMDDETDIIFLKDGLATLKVTNFSQEPTK